LTDHNTAESSEMKYALSSLNLSLRFGVLKRKNIVRKSKKPLTTCIAVFTIWYHEILSFPKYQFTANVRFDIGRVIFTFPLVMTSANDFRLALSIWR
jgi:hypothetical protein